MSAALIADLFLLPPNCSLSSKSVTSARYDSLVATIFSETFPRQLSREIIR